MKTRFGSFEFDPSRHELRRRGQRVDTSASQLRLLTLFVERAGEVVTRDEVAKRLWADTRNIDVTTGINTAINRLRRHLQEAPGSPTPLETVVGVGYRFVATVEKVETDEAPVEKSAVTNVPTNVDVSNEVVVLQNHDSSAEQGLAAQASTQEPERTPIQVQSVSPKSKRPIFSSTWLVAGLSSILLVSLLSVVFFFGYRHRSAAPTVESASPVSRPLDRVTADEEVGNLRAAAMAPNGDRIAYANRFGVSVHWFASGIERLLGVRPSFSVERLSWLPDGSGLLMSGRDPSSARHQVWFVPQQGAYLSLVAEDANRATVSPDGTEMAFTKNQDRELWVADISGRNQRPIRKANPGESFHLVIWNAHGNRLIATLRTASFTAVEADAATQGDAYICMDAASGQVLAREEGFYTDSGYLLADGRFFFLMNETPGPTTGKALLMVVPTDPVNGRLQGSPHLVQNLEARRGQDLTASTDGARFGVIRLRSETDVHVADVKPSGLALSNEVRLTKGPRQSFPHSWSEDGKSVIFESDLLKGGLATKWAVYSQPLDKTLPTLIVKLPQSAAMPELSPDGKWILFTEFAGQPQRATGVYRVPATGGNIEQVRTSGPIEEFHCSATVKGRCVLREALGNEALVYYALDPVDGMGKEVGREDWQPNRLGDWGLSADGATVAAAGHDANNPSIRLIRVDDSGAQVKTISVAGHGTTLGASWTIDGQKLLVECKTDIGFELISLDLSGRIQLLRKSPSLTYAVPSRDGKKIAFPALNLSQSLWAGLRSK